MWQKKILWRLPNKNGGQDGDPGPKEVLTARRRMTIAVAGQKQMPKALKPKGPIPWTTT